MTVQGMNVLIIGMARSGISAAKLCYNQGANVSIYDGKGKENFCVQIKELKDFPFKYTFGEFEDSLLDNTHLLILSPGVPTDLWFIMEARNKGIHVIGEIELAYRYCKADVIAITGTNGKTTTTALVGEIAKRYNSKTYVVGNIGSPFSDEALKCQEKDLVVAEVSSFQLESIHTFEPKVSAILNLKEDHLNRHKTLENYWLSKLRITENQNKRDTCVLNFDDPEIEQYKNKIQASILWFSMDNEVHGVYVKENAIYSNVSGDEQIILPLSKIKLLGKHNIENILAATCICMAYGIPVKCIREGIENFNGVAHRIEFVREVNGVSYYNDSKATNPDSAIKGIEAMITPTVLIGGGMDKGSDYDAWIESFDNKVKALILFGETKQMIKKTALSHDFLAIHIVDDLEEAIHLSKELAEKGDSVLLSPACASWDMFKDYEVRGDLFKSIVIKI